MEGHLKTPVHELLPDTVDSGQTNAQRLGNGVVGVLQPFRTRIGLESNAGMEHWSGRPRISCYGAPMPITQTSLLAVG
jgi:hypothetical protein